MMGVALWAALALFSLAAQQPRDLPGELVVGTATIAGVVVSAEDAATPIRRALVTVSGATLGRPRSAITDDQGRFELSGLPVGRFLVTARKPAYLDMAFGAKRPGRPGTPVLTAAGQRTDVNLTLARGAVIAGVVRDEHGAPVAGVTVRAIDARGDDQSRLYGEAEAIVSDDRGMYRIYGLPPGGYVVVATARSIGTGAMGRTETGEMDALLGRLQARGRGIRPGQTQPELVSPETVPVTVTLAPTYHPDTAMREDARVVTLGTAETRTDVDVTMTPIPAVRIAGSVSDGGAPLGTGVQLSITREGEHRSLARGTPGSRPILSEPPGEDGRFTFTNVAPGRYTIVARSRRSEGVPAVEPQGSGRGMISVGGGGALGPGRMGGPGALPGGDEYFFARARVSVNGADVEGLALALRPGSTLAGRVTFEGTSDPPVDPTDLVVRVLPRGGTGYSISNNTIMGNTFSAVRPASVGSDGSFRLTSIAPDEYVLSAPLPQGAEGVWWLKSAEVGGRDLLDAPFDVGDDLTGVVLTYTDRRAELTGRLQTAAGAAAPDYFIVVVPADRSRWVRGSRRMISMRPDTNGRFNITDLPAGEYLVAALTDFEPADLADETFLTELAGIAVPVVTREGSQTVQDLEIATAQ